MHPMITDSKTHNKVGQVQNPTNRILPNPPLQLTAGSFCFYNVFGVVVGFGLSDGFRQTPAATELGR